MKYLLILLPVMDRSSIYIDSIPMLKLNSKKKIFYYFLHRNVDLIELLDEKWRLVIASVIFWAESSHCL